MIGFLTATKAEIDGREDQLIGLAGIGWPNGRRTHIRCPFPHHDDKSPSWRWDDRKRRYFCTCGSGDALDAAMHMQGFADLTAAADWARNVLGLPGRDGRNETPVERQAREARVAAARQRAEEDQRRREAEDAEDAARTIEWIRGPLYERVLNLAKTPAEAYLRARGIGLTEWPDSLGFVDGYGDERLPAMVAFFGIPDEPEPGVLKMPRERIAGVHLTFLKADGRGKATNSEGKSKIIIGRGHSLPIVLAPANDIGGLVVAEGIEDGLTLHQETGLGAWASGTAGRLAGLADQIPAHVDAVTVVEDDDDAGRKGCKALATALHRRDIEVFIVRGKRALDEGA